MRRIGVFLEACDDGAMVVGREFEVILEEQDDGGFVASVPDLPGVWTQAETRDEAIAMVKDAIAGHLETLEGSHETRERTHVRAVPWTRGNSS